MGLDFTPKKKAGRLVFRTAFAKLLPFSLNAEFFPGLLGHLQFDDLPDFGGYFKQNGAFRLQLGGFFFQSGLEGLLLRVDLSDFALLFDETGQQLLGKSPLSQAFLMGRAAVDHYRDLVHSLSIR